MFNQFPLWKNLLVVFVVVMGTLYALPNLYGQDPALDIAAQRQATIDDALIAKVEETLKKGGVTIKAIERRDGRLLLRFNRPEDQLKARDLLSEVLPREQYTQALNLVADVPDWLTAIGGKPMSLGLDLRGGIHVLIDVDMETALAQAVDRYRGDIRSLLRKEKVGYLSVNVKDQSVVVRLRDEDALTKARDLVAKEFRDLTLKTEEKEGQYLLVASLNEAKQRAVKKFALQQNITTLRNRINALGVSEPLVQQQGERRIVVELPGVQDPGRVKNILGATATLEYRLVDTEHDVQDALAGRVPAGSRLYRERNGRPILLKKQVIVTGNQITDASAGFDQRSGQPSVNVSLDSQGARRMRNVTTENVGKPMAVVFIEDRIIGRDKDGKAIKRRVEEVINVASIREPFGARFQTTGLDSPAEAHDLALLLRAGALAAPIEIVEERTIGPSLGKDNIEQGFISVVVGMLVVMVFMAVYYKAFGLVADLALLMNLVLIVAILSLLQATLTLPGIAGIVLTVGMAVDANVLIFERIREEIRVGNTPQASIHSGYAKAFSTIMDANITTLIAAVVLFSIGSGPVRGFAVTLAIGILTSMFTAIIGTRAVINLIYGGRRVTKLAI